MKHDPNSIEFGIGPSIWEWIIIAVVAVGWIAGIISIVLLLKELLP